MADINSITGTKTDTRDLWNEFSIDRKIGEKETRVKERRGKRNVVAINTEGARVPCIRSKLRESNLPWVRRSCATVYLILAQDCLPDSSNEFVPTPRASR